MTDQHTPGPWSVDQAPDGRLRIFTGSTPFYGTVADIHGEFAKPGTDLRTQYEANARLIAAAPAMLDALRAVLDSIADIPWCKEQVEAALAQATGERSATA